MARQSVFVHGNAVVMRFPGGKGDPVGSPHTSGHQMNGVNSVEWSDVVGFHQDFGVTFRGRRGQKNQFMVAIPSPSRLDGPHGFVEGASFTFSSDAGVLIKAVHLFDNRSPLLDLPILLNPLMTHVGDEGLSGDHSQFVDNVNSFVFAGHDITAVGMTFDVDFQVEGNITFFCAGATFEV